MQIQQVVVDDPVATLRCGESDLAVALVTGPSPEEFEAVPVRVWSRGRRVELLNRPDLRSQARAVVDHLS
ncbi:hypothetical protein AXK57_10165 [Tsukamurella pulmonis]|uniref:hypothetical protein n=1 Tax=Tsukamurella pulmonis TaxID=47312 RepID=UPI0007995D68|nr:hypothetical protein [Tsukamurella pulmonis]KXP10672.1 hypothetical protein AXK57_10165 [Tsukamurella pulmonis]RDH12185.1 hypothetical protein DVB88_08760 [Tsukamurella pulmonis]